MKKIELRCKKHPHLFALVDDEDFERVNKIKWYALDSNKNGKLFYAINNSTGKTILLHRFILGFPDPGTVDHTNGNGLDCRKNNLRIASRSENARNRKFTKNKTGFIGVYKNKHRFQASVRINGKNKSIGYFSTAKNAAKAREKFVKKLFGDFYADR